MIHVLAVNYHWSEREILGLRFDRAAAYLDEIRLDAGEHPVRKEPIIPGEELLDSILLDHLRKHDGKIVEN